MGIVTGDYRPYDKPLKGRGYKIYRIFINNFVSMISKWYTILVLAFSFAFLFVNIIIIVITAMAVENEESMVFEGINEVYFEIVPESPEDLHVTTFFNSSVTLRYKVTNVGKNVTTPIFLFLTPNSLWNYTMDYPEGEMEPGDSITVEIRLEVPDNHANALAQETGRDIFNRSTDERNLDLLREILGPDIVIDLPPEYLELPTSPEYFFGGSTIYKADYSRLTMLLAAPGDILEDFLSGTSINYDPKVAFISTLISIDREEPALYSGSAWKDKQPDLNFTNTFDMEIEGSVRSQVRMRMTADDSESISVTIRNTGNISIDVKLEALFMQASDHSVEIYDNRDHEDNAEGLIQPGEEMEYTVKIFSGVYPFKKPYNIILIATETNRSEYHGSRVAQVIVDIEGPAETEELKEALFRTFWGKELNYERFLWLILLTAVCGAGIISYDLKNNTFTIYLSRPLTWFDYALGKFMALGGILTLITLVPAVVIFLVEFAFKEESLSYFLANLPILGGMLLSYLIAIVVFSSIALALSSMTKRGIYAGIGIFTFFIFTPPVADLLVELFKNDYLKLININLVLKNLFRPFYGIPYNSGSVGFGYHLLVLVVLILVIGSWALLFVRFHDREVAK